jgi:FlaA1/EpsC-like NDP-sugar epimerase
VPGLPELLTGQFNNVLFRDARLEDLLGRPPVAFPHHGHHGSSPAKSVLITGAAGSIGSELARQVAATRPANLVLLDTNESGLFDLAAELQAGGDRDTKVCVVVADITRARRLHELFASHRPTIVYHAAAYKHVPLMEQHPREAVITNVVGTLTLCTAAEASWCERVVFISTDKAVAPASVMGATKRVGEHVIRAFSEDSQTIFCAVRFGNVLGSRGSVVPTFTRQIRDGGPITITHAQATRFFMTLPEAASLIIEAAYHAEGGEIFILDMGERVRILDLARKMIRLQGLRPEQDIQIQEIGLRPGERVHEMLVTGGEELVPTAHPRVSRVRPTSESTISRADLLRAVEELGSLAELGSTEALVAALFGLAESPGGRAPAYAGGLVEMSA